MACISDAGDICYSFLGSFGIRPCNHSRTSHASGRPRPSPSRGRDTIRPSGMRHPCCYRAGSKDYFIFTSPVCCICLHKLILCSDPFSCRGPRWSASRGRDHGRRRSPHRGRRQPFQRRRPQSRGDCGCRGAVHSRCAASRDAFPPRQRGRFGGGWSGI